MSDPWLEHDRKYGAISDRYDATQRARDEIVALRKVAAVMFDVAFTNDLRLARAEALEEAAHALEAADNFDWPNAARFVRTLKDKHNG